MDAVIQGLIADPFSLELALGLFVPVEAELGAVWEVGAELQEKGAKVLVHRSRNSNDSPGLWTSRSKRSWCCFSDCAVSPCDRRCTSLGPCLRKRRPRDGEFLPKSGRHIVLALPLFESH
jgi:hypothetical protein